MGSISMNGGIPISDLVASPTGRGEPNCLIDYGDLPTAPSPRPFPLAPQLHDWPVGIA